jgi:23S rRNA A2030 N6-methylase RlmJ
MNRPIIDYNTTDVRIIKHNALRAALRGDDAMMNCTTYIDTHAGPGCHNNCPGSPMIASDHFNELFLYENNPEDFNKLKRNMRAGCILREADGFKSYCYSDKKTFVFMDPPFKSIRDYFKVANYLQTVSGIGALMLMYPVNTFFPIEDFHCMLQRQIGGVNFLIKKAAERQLKNMPKDQRDMIMKILENNPDLFVKMSKEMEHKMKKEGKDQMLAMMEVSKKYQKELKEALE